MTPNKLQQKILTIWRLYLIAAAIPPAFLCSFFFDFASLPWFLLSAAWVLLFLFLYLIYLPLRYRRISFLLDEKSICLYSGVFVRKTAMLPFLNIQFTSVLANPCDRLFGLCTLRIVAPGARMEIPGLKRENAEELASILTEHQEGLS